MVTEIVSPHDESWQKLGFYAEHTMDEVVIIDPDQRRIDWLARHDGDYLQVECSALIGLGPRTLAEQLGWMTADPAE
jgi:Uma2 family endonuclease